LKNKSAFWLATWFGSGLFPKAPGTIGSIAALPFGLALLYYTDAITLFVASAVLFVIGCWAADIYEKNAGQKDPSAVVIDEVVGVWLALVPTGLDMLWVTVAFIAFRFFDILKPWPVSYADKHLKGGFGIMVDDVFAGLMAAGVVLIGLWGTGL